MARSNKLAWLKIYCTAWCRKCGTMYRKEEIVSVTEYPSWLGEDGVFELTFMCDCEMAVTGFVCGLRLMSTEESREYQKKTKQNDNTIQSSWLKVG